jgi:hypothetical protein
MRVSTAFKAMSAPLLYKDLEWYHVARKNALGLVKKGNVIKASRMDTKETELKHIKLIEMLNHYEIECPATGPRTRQSPLVLPVLRFALSDHEAENSYRRRSCLEFSNCPHLKGLAQKRLVFITNGADGEIRLHRNNTSHLEELVVHLKLSQYGLQEITKLLLQGTPKRLVVVLSHPRRLIDPHHSISAEETLFRCMLSIAVEVVDFARLRQSPLEIVLVNFEDFHKRYISPESEVESFEHVLKECWEEFEPEEWLAPPGRQWRTASEAAQVSFKYLTTDQYKREYDHAGVYPKEYPAYWLGETSSFGGSDYGGH